METNQPIPEISNLPWSSPREIDTAHGPMLVKSAIPSEQFWNLWREKKEALQHAGFSVVKFGGAYRVNWWERDRMFLFPKLGEITNVEAMELQLKPLVNEKNILPFQYTLIQQIVAANKKYGASLNGCSTGVGKTYITLAASREIGRRLMVICPKGIREDWIRAAFYMGVTLVGAYGWEWIKTGKTPYGSWEKAWVRKNKILKQVKGNFVWSIPDDVDIVFDEIHRASGIDTQNSHILIRAVEQYLSPEGRHNIYGLSATVANDPTKMKAVGQMLGLHKGDRDFYGWMIRNGVRKHQFKIGGRKVIKDGKEITIGGRQVTIWKFQGTARHLQVIHGQIFPHRGCRVRADQLGDAFPPSQILAKAYNMDEESEINKAYEEMMEKVEAIMKSKETNKQSCILTEILRARQKVELLKVPLMISLTRDYEEEGNSVFLAVNFRDTLNELIKALKIKSFIMGGQRDFDRRNAIDDFQNNKETKIAGIIQACREGLNLHDIHGEHPRVSLIMPTPSSNDLRQALGRVGLRAGGKTPSLQRILFAANTVEEEVCKGLATKLDHLDLIMDGDLQQGIFPPSYSLMRPQVESV